MIKESLPKLRIKSKISHVRVSFLVSLLFVAEINPYSVFKLLISIILVCLIMQSPSNVIDNLHILFVLLYILFIIYIYTEIDWFLLILHTSVAQV